MKSFSKKSLRIAAASAAIELAHGRIGERAANQGEWDIIDKQAAAGKSEEAVGSSHGSPHPASVGESSERRQSEAVEHDHEGTANSGAVFVKLRANAPIGDVDEAALIELGGKTEEGDAAADAAEKAEKKAEKEATEAGKIKLPEYKDAKAEHEKAATVYQQKSVYERAGGGFKSKFKSSAAARREAKADLFQAKSLYHAGRKSELMMYEPGDEKVAIENLADAFSKYLTALQYAASEVVFDFERDPEESEVTVGTKNRREKSSEVRKKIVEAILRMLTDINTPGFHNGNMLWRDLKDVLMDALRFVDRARAFTRGTPGLEPERALWAKIQIRTLEILRQIQSGRSYPDITVQNVDEQVQNQILEEVKENDEEELKKNDSDY